LPLWKAFHNGKTQLAIEYVHRMGYLYPGGIYWIDAEQATVENIISEILSYTGIQMDPKHSIQKQYTKLWHKLASRGRILFVLDN